MLAVVCVLRGKDRYRPRHVEALKQMVRRHLPVEHEFCCFTDRLGDMIGKADRVIPLHHAFPGYWSKIEMFRPQVFTGQRVLYLDLDIVVTGDLSDIASYAGRFAALRDEWGWTPINSSVMAWEGDELDHIHAEFLADPMFHMSRCKKGDQELIGRLESPDIIQDLYPGQVAWFKAKGRHDEGGYKREIDGERIVVFTGRPKPWDVTDESPWVRAHYPTTKELT